MSQAGAAMVREAAQKVWEQNPEILQPIAEFYEVDLKERLKNDKYWQAA